MTNNMHYWRAAAFLLPLLAAVVNGSQYIQSRIIASGMSCLSISWGTDKLMTSESFHLCLAGGCDSYTCGTNARCTMSEGRPVCSCLNLHMGDPLARCVRVECLSEF